MIYYGKQSINDDDVAAVSAVVKSPLITQGPRVETFEKDLCAYTGAKYCVLVANGTAALHIAVAALELPANSEGITSPITFVASSNSMIYSGMKPCFADIDEKTFNLSPDKVREKITPKTKLIMPVHFAGYPCDMEAFSQIAAENNLHIIEDAAHAIGSSYSCGAKVGSCKYSDMTIFSFHPVKNITSGEGGAVLTNDENLYKKLLLLRGHGITKDPHILTQNPGVWYYEMQKLGFNYRMTDFQAALGISQLKRISTFKAKRLNVFSQYNEAFKDLENIAIPHQHKSEDVCYHLYAARFDFAALKQTRQEFIDNLKQYGVMTQVHYIPVHLQPYYQQNYGFKRGDFPHAEHFYEQELSLPLYPDLTDEEIKLVINSVKKCIKSA